MEFSDFIAIFVSVIVVVIALWIIVISLKNGIGPVPTSPRVKSRVLALVPQHVDGTIVELGAGWGGVTLALARKYPQSAVLAVENSLPVWCICWLRMKLSGCQNIQVRLGDIRRINFEGVGLVYCYLFQGAMDRLAQQLSENPTSLFLISNTFALPSYTPEQTLRADDLWRSCIYRYHLRAS